jgi:hypothetical protein
VPIGAPSRQSNESAYPPAIGIDAATQSLSDENEKRTLSGHRKSLAASPKRPPPQAVDLRTINRHSDATVTSMIPALLCRSRRTSLRRYAERKRIIVLAITYISGNSGEMLPGVLNWPLLSVGWEALWGELP